MDFAPASESMSLDLTNVGKPLDLNPRTFGPAVKMLTLENVRMREFSTDSFVGMSADSEIHVIGSNISSQAYVSSEHGDAITTLKVKALTFNRCLFSHLEFK